MFPLSYELTKTDNNKLFKLMIRYSNHYLFLRYF